MPLERALNGTPRHDADAQREPVRPVAGHADLRRRRRRVQLAQHGGRSAWPQAELPDGVTPKLAPEATPLGEVYQFRVDERPPRPLPELRAELEWTIVARAAQVPGVADVVTFGGYLKEIHVEVDPVAAARARPHAGRRRPTRSRKSNINVGGGFLQHGDQELTVRGIGYLDIGRRTSGASC